jgi:hypothetical protein
VREKDLEEKEIKRKKKGKRERVGDHFSVWGRCVSQEKLRNQLRILAFWVVEN